MFYGNLQQDCSGTLFQVVSLAFIQHPTPRGPDPSTLKERVQAGSGQAGESLRVFSQFYDFEFFALAQS